MKYLILFTLFCQAVLLANTPKILFISSYNSSFPTIPKQIIGIKDVLPESQYQIDIEYMDTKRFHPTEVEPIFLSNLMMKKELLKSYDVILVGDDNGLRFVQKYQDKLFKNKPIVFLAINNEPYAKEISKNRYITGVIEKQSVTETIDLIINLHPSSSKIFVIADTTTTSDGILKSFSKDDLNSIEILSLKKYSYQELRDKLKSLPKGQPLLYVSGMADKLGERKEFYKSIEFIKQSADLPLYHLYEHGIGEGMIGGKVVMFSKQGEIAAEMAKQVLDGKDVKDIDYIPESKNHYLFDYSELKKYRIKESVLPTNSIIINKPTSFIKENFETILSVMTIILSLMLVFIVSLLIKSKRKSLELKELNDNLEEKVKENTKDIIVANENLQQSLRQTEEMNDDLEEANILLKRAEEELNSLNNQLEKKVDEQTKELSEANRQLNSITETIPDILYRCEINNNWTMSYMNDAIYKVTGYPKEEFINDEVRSFESIIHPEDTQHVSDVVISAVEKNEPYKINYRLISKDGREIEVYESGQKVVDIDNNEILEGIIRDITEDKAKDKQLFESQKMASLGEMIGNIAHQWRQPLSVISTAASGLKLEKEFGTINDDKFNDAMDGIVRTTKYLSETINTFRNFIKKTSSKERSEVSIQECLEGAISISRASLDNNNIELIKNIDSDLKVTIVKGELPQVIINIINNAKDVIVEKEIVDPKIEVNLIEKNDKVIITVEDNGGGIPKDALPKIFDPYFTTKHQSQGTGLGLHMSYKIVTESLGGKIYVQNTKSGAKFFVELPLDN